MNLKELAKARGTNLKKLSERMGIPASTLYAISQGDTTLDNAGVSTFIKLGEALDMTVESIYASLSLTPEEFESYIEGEERREEASELMAILDTLDDRGRRVLMQTARALAE